MPSGPARLPQEQEAPLSLRKLEEAVGTCMNALQKGESLVKKSSGSAEAPSLGYKGPGNSLSCVCLFVLRGKRQKAVMESVPYSCSQEDACMLILLLALRTDGNKSKESERYGSS